jgi:flagella basal body P-ring formation protein FlgA
MRNFLVITGILLLDFSLAASVCAQGTQSNEVSGGGGLVAVDTEAGRLLKSELVSKYPGVSRWSITAQIRQSPIEIPKGVSSSMQVTRIGSRSAVQVSWVGLRSTRQVHTIWFDVTGIQSIVVAAHDIAPASALSTLDATVEERDLIGLGCSPMHDASDLQQKRARRALRYGAAICLEAIEPRPAVARGENVTVRYSSERVSITSQGIAQDDGQVGQRLRVVNPISKDSFLAVVSAAREVLVHE